MLHEGLGSVGLWGTFPDQIAAATGAGVFVYSRAGYGKSAPGTLPRSTRFMHEEACAVLPRVLDAIGFQRGLLLGHSDGASIATIYAGSVQDHRVRGLALLAPHFFTEHMGIAEIRRACDAFATGTFRDKLARWHADVDCAFRSWSEPWLDPEFRKWDITEALGYIRVPILIVQGDQDQYGTLRQLEVAKDECYCPVETLVLPGVRHVPQRDAPEATLGAVSDFIARLLRDHHEGDRRADSGVAASRIIVHIEFRHSVGMHYNTQTNRVGNGTGYGRRSARSATPLGERRDAHRFSDRTGALPSLDACRRRRGRDADHGRR
jgi:pimeloyl-ACP methyl ester carboxylesterase